MNWLSEKAITTLNLTIRSGTSVYLLSVNTLVRACTSGWNLFLTRLGYHSVMTSRPCLCSFPISVCHQAGQRTTSAPVPRGKHTHTNTHSVRAVRRCTYCIIFRKWLEGFEIKGFCATGKHSSLHSSSGIKGRTAHWRCKGLFREPRTIFFSINILFRTNDFLRGFCFIIRVPANIVIKNGTTRQHCACMVLFFTASFHSLLHVAYFGFTMTFLTIRRELNWIERKTKNTTDIKSCYSAGNIMAPCQRWSMSQCFVMWNDLKSVIIPV